VKRQAYHRRQLFKTWLVFQMKLFLDWIRDLLFTPLAFICMVADLISGADEKSGLFHQLMKFGAQTDRWIDMFNQHADEDGHRFDHLVDHTEQKWRERQKQK